MHSTYNLNDGYLGSGLKLIRSVAKYGKENFKVEILKFFDDRDTLALNEKLVVNEEILKDPLCMNIKPGGKGGWTTEEHRLGAKKSHEKKKFLKENNPEWVENLSKSLSNYRKEEYRNGSRPIKLPSFAGFNHKENAKKLIGSKNSIHQKGNKNSQFGKCWIYNDKIQKAKSIKKEELQKYLDIGWIKGFKRYNYNKGDYLYVHNETETIFIKKEELQSYLDKNWIKGRKSESGSIYVHNNRKTIFIKKEEIEKYLNNGWSKGRKPNNHQSNNI